MRVDSPAPRGSSKRISIGICAGIFALLVLPGAIRWVLEGSPPASGDVSSAPADAPASGKNAARGEAVPAVTDERDSPTVERAGVDASPLYKDAFALYDRLTDKDKEMLLRPSAEVDAEKAEALFAKIQPIMELLRRGAAADYCDWGLGEYRLETPLPQITKSQTLGKVALWNAAYRFPSDAGGAIDDLATRARLGHDIADTLIGLLVDASFEKSAADLLRVNAPAFDEATRTKTAAFLAASTIDRDIETCMAGEESFGRDIYKQLASQSPDERAKLIATMGLADADDVDLAARSRRERAEAVVRDSDLLRAEMEFVQKAQAQMAEAMHWPDAQFEAWMQQFDASHSAEHPFAATTMPVYRGIRTQLQARRIEREMLSVGLAVFASGPAETNRSRDPVTGRPFDYVQTPAGFELRSTFQSKGKPVAMSFAQPKQ